MKVVGDFKVVFKPNPHFYIECPYCGHINVEIDWIRFEICEKCGKIFSMTPDAIQKMMKIIDEYEKKFLELI